MAHSPMPAVPPVPPPPPPVPPTVLDMTDRDAVASEMEALMTRLAREHADNSRVKERAGIREKTHINPAFAEVVQAYKDLTAGGKDLRDASHVSLADFEAFTARLKDLNYEEHKHLDYAAKRDQHPPFREAMKKSTFVETSDGAFSCTGMSDKGFADERRRRLANCKNDNEKAGVLIAFAVRWLIRKATGGPVAAAWSEAANNLNQDVAVLTREVEKLNKEAAALRKEAEKLRAEAAALRAQGPEKEKAAVEKEKKAEAREKAADGKDALVEQRGLAVQLQKDGVKLQVERDGASGYTTARFYRDVEVKDPATGEVKKDPRTGEPLTEREYLDPKEPGNEALRQYANLVRMDLLGQGFSIPPITTAQGMQIDAAAASSSGMTLATPGPAASTVTGRPASVVPDHNPTAPPLGMA